MQVCERGWKLSWPGASVSTEAPVEISNAPKKKLIVELLQCLGQLSPIFPNI